MKETASSCDAKGLTPVVWLHVNGWNTQQLHVDCGRDKNGEARDLGATLGTQAEDGGARATRDKLDWLETQLKASRPAVLGLLEIAGTRKAWAPLRKWLKLK